MKSSPSPKAARIAITIWRRRIWAQPSGKIYSASLKRRSNRCSKNATKNSAGWAILPKAKAQLPRPVREMIRSDRRVFAQIFRIGVLVALTQSSSFAAAFSFERDTFAFQNATVLKYKNAVPFLRARSTSNDPANKYTRRCFVMTRTVMQFRKFARFDPRGAPLDDKPLAPRIRAVSRHFAWQEPLPENERIVFPGYANLRQMSKARAEVFKENIGSGFITYFRPSNARMFFQHSRKYQDRTQAHLDAALSRGDLFVGYLSTYPKLSIYHAVLVYAREKGRPG